MLVRISEYDVINTKDIKRVEKSSVSGIWIIYTYEDSSYSLDTCYYDVEGLIKYCNGEV